MRIQYLLAIMVICLSEVFAQAGIRPQKEGEYDVFLCIGQSNMAGRGMMEAEDTVVIPGVFILNGNEQIEPARAPLNRYSTVRKKISFQQIGPADEFSRIIAARTGRRILLVVNARGGSSIEKWKEDSEPYYYRKKEWDIPEDYGKPVPSLYSEAVRRAAIAMKYGRLRGILWHQGESDAKSDQANYLNDLTALASSLRKDLDVDRRVPFVVGETGRKYENSSLVNPTLNNVPKRIPNSWCVSSEGCEMNNDNLHFSRDGQHLLGSRYAEVILRKVYKIRFKQ